MFRAAELLLQARKISFSKTNAEMVKVLPKTR